MRGSGLIVLMCVAVFLNEAFHHDGITPFAEPVPIPASDFTLSVQRKNNTPYIHCYNHTTLCGCALNSKSKTMHEEKRWKLWQVSETVLVFPLSSLVFPLLYFFRRTWDSANNCCQQTKQTNYTVSPHCNIAVMDDDVPWKHCKKYSRLVCAVLANYF